MYILLNYGIILLSTCLLIILLNSLFSKSLNIKPIIHHKPSPITTNQPSTQTPLTPPTTNPSKIPSNIPSNIPSDPLLSSLQSQFTSLISQTAGSQPNHPWTTVLTQSVPNTQFNIQVQQKKNTDFTFRIICDFECTPEDAFDYLCDINLRPQWDELCTHAGITEKLNNFSCIQYLRTKGLWPTAPRDALVISYVIQLPDKPRSYLNITQSVDSHPNYKSTAGDVRMLANLAGTLVEPHPTVDGISRVTQIMDGDLMGWLPKSIVGVISTQMFPISMKR